MSNSKKKYSTNQIARIANLVLSIVVLVLALLQIFHVISVSWLLSFLMAGVAAANATIYKKNKKCSMVLLGFAALLVVLGIILLVI